MTELDTFSLNQLERITVALDAATRTVVDVLAQAQLLNAHILRDLDYYWTSQTQAWRNSTEGYEFRRWMDEWKYVRDHICTTEPPRQLLDYISCLRTVRTSID